MNERIEHCLYAAGLTADGCWDKLDDYAKEGIEQFAQLIIKECLDQCYYRGMNDKLYAGQLKAAYNILQHFGLSNE